MLFTTYQYDDAGRMVRAEHSPEYTRDDYALLIALNDAEDALKVDEAPCGLPRSLAYHAETDGWWEHNAYKCYRCSALQGEDVYHDEVEFTLPPEKVLAPFEIGKTTESKPN